MMSEDDRVNANVLIREIFSREVLRADIESNPSDGEQMVNALRKALENPDTNDFDAGVEVAADMLLGGQLLPDWLATFAAGVLRGELKRPTKRGPDKYTNWIRDYTIARAVVEVSERFGLPKYTNNELSYKVTASQIVAETTHFSIEVVHHAVKNFGGRIKSETLPQVSTD